MEQIQTVLDSMNLTIDKAINILIPIAILIIGWLLALILSGGVRRLLKRTKVDDKIAELLVGKERAASIDTARWTGKLVYYIVMLLVIVGFLQRLGRRSRC